MKKNLLESLSEVKDFRQSSGQRHPLQIVLLCMIMGILSGRMGLRAIAQFTQRHKKELIAELKIRKGRVPSYSTFQRVITGLNFNDLAVVFNDWASQFLEKEESQPWLAIDGKVIKGTITHPQTPFQNWTNLVSIFGVKSGIVLGTSSFESHEMSEIQVVPQLIKELGLKGAVLTLDALHCQKKTVKQIIDSGNDYVIAVKGNQPKLLQAIKSVCNEASPINSYCYQDNSRGRKVKRTVKIYPASDEMAHQFQGLQRFICVERDVEREGQRETTLSYHISSLEASARRFSLGIVGHRGGVENRLHWVLDVVFKEDDSSITTSSGPQNFSLLRKIAINIFSSQGFKSITGAIRKVADDILPLVELLN